MKHIGWLVLLILMMGCSRSIETVKEAAVLDALYQQHEQWRGTPYRMGGMSHQGIDCSGFVQLTFAEQFGVQLPRTTRAQSRLKPKVNSRDLKTGDLIFFKIPKQGKTYHVGIYLEDNRFLHASTSKGVTVSTLESKYWQDNYWQAVRVVD